VIAQCIPKKIVAKTNPDCARFLSFVLPQSSNLCFESDQELKMILAVLQR